MTPIHAEPCSHCPRVAKGLPLPCIAMTTGHHRYCHLTDPTTPENTPGDPRYMPGRAEGFTAIVCDQVETPPTSDQRVSMTYAADPPKVATEHTAEPEPIPPPRVAMVPLDVLVALTRRMNECPHRGPLDCTSCGGFRPCALGRGRGGKVCDFDCFACLQSDDPGDVHRTELPSLLTRAANFVAATASHAVAGFPEVDDPTFESRMTVCRGCDQFQDDHCLKCGCPLATKARWADQACPIGKWPAAVGSEVTG